MFKTKKTSGFKLKRLFYRNGIWYIFWIGLLIISILTGVKYKMQSEVRNDLYSKCTLEDLKSRFTISVSNYMDSIRSSQEHGLVNYLTENQEFYLDECRSSTAKVIARPTGNLFLEKEVLGQEFVIIQVLDGDDIKAGKTVVCYSHASIAERSGILNYNGLINLMNPEYTYMVFMEPSGLNSFQDKMEFYFSSELFPYVRIGENSNNYKVLNSLSLADCQDAEFMTVKEENLAKLYEIKEILISEIESEY